MKKIKKDSKFIKNNIKKTIKTLKTTSKNIKKSKEVVKATTKGAKKTYEIAKLTAKVVIEETKVIAKATVELIKAIASAIKELIALIVAGGWVAVVIIIVICLIIGIIGFFLFDDNGSILISNAISDINKEFTKEITKIGLQNEHTDFDISSNRADWKNVLAIYTIKQNKKTNDRIAKAEENSLKKVYFDMNKINYSIEDIENKKILHIVITSKSLEEMIEMYSFNDIEKRQLYELLSEKYNELWSSVIYGANGSGKIVEVAISQIGNVGGAPYWSWYGFDSRVEWCACFVSWCANECNYIEKGVIPKFASCDSEGVAWFKACGLWQERTYNAKAGDIIFFDWADETGNRNNLADHVGIVEKIENGIVYTIEGNTEDSCLRRNYNVNSLDILGYGVIRF